MSNEIQITGQLQYTNSAQNIAAKTLAVLGLTVNITGKNFTQGMMAVPTTAGGTAIPITTLSTLGWAIFKNNDPTNYVELYTGVGGIAMTKVKPGEPSLFRFGSGVTAPAMKANTAAVEVEFLIVED